MLQPVRAPAFSPDLPAPERTNLGEEGESSTDPRPSARPAGVWSLIGVPHPPRSTTARTAVGVDTIGETEEATAAVESTPSAIAVFCVKELQLKRARSPSEGVSGVCGESGSCTNTTE